MLAVTHGVHAIMHVATVRGARTGLGLKADADDLALCVRNVLTLTNERNRRHRLLKRVPWIRRLFALDDSTSVLFPLIGAGDGGLAIERVVPELFGGAAAYYQQNPSTTITDIYFLAFNAAQESVCKREIERLRRAKVIEAD
jgi:O-acetyl-ADP-ribose deacetylase (regulator of RNase III)